MASFNKVLLMGNLTRDPELTYTPSQIPVCKFGLAINKKYRTKGGEEREDVLFVDCTAFDKRGEVISQHFTKGKPIFVEGSLKMDSWDDKQTGQKRSKLYVIVDNFQFVGGRDGGGGGDGDSQEEERAQAPQRRPAGRPAPQRRPAGRPAPRQAPTNPIPDDDNNFKDDDIPF